MIVPKAKRTKGSPAVAVGFNYVLAINRLLDGGIHRAKLNYCLGFGKGSTMLSRILAGATPNHYAGEMLYAVCLRYFGREKLRAELMTPEQRDGDLLDRIIEKHLGVQHLTSK